MGVVSIGCGFNNWSDIKIEWHIATIVPIPLNVHIINQMYGFIILVDPS